MTPPTEAAPPGATPPGALPPGFTLREALPADEGPVGRVAYLTGFFGDSAERYFPDQQLFADLWVRPYLHGGGGASFVLEREGQVCGYILGALDQGAYTRAVLGVILTCILPGLLRGRYHQPLPALGYFGRSLLFPSPHADWGVFPAHLHLNLLAGVRGLGLSRPLLEKHLDRLEERGVRGVQLSTTLENVAALKVYRKHGFIVVAARRSAFWKPWLGRSAVHVTLARPVQPKGWGN